MTDGEIVQLLARVARHEQQAEPLLWMQLKPEVSQTARRMLDGSDADDAVAEILQKILSRAGSYRAEQAGPRTWVHHIAENHCRDMLDRRRKGGASGAEVPWDEQAAHAVPATAPGPYTYVIGNDAEDKWLSGSQQWVSQMITVDGKVLRFTPEHRDCMKVMLERDKGGTPVLNFNVEQLALKLQRPRQTVQHLVQRIWQFLEHSGEGPRVMEGFRDLWAHRPEIRTALFKPTEPGT